jgi:hypothetical protein
MIVFNSELRITNCDFVCLCVIRFVIFHNNLPLNPLNGTSGMLGKWLVTHTRNNRVKNLPQGK